MVRRKTMGQRLREAREEAGLTIKALAGKIERELGNEIGFSTIRQVEQGIVKNPGIKTIELMARGLHLPPLEVMAMALDDPPPESTQRFSQSRFAAISEIYEPLPRDRKVFYDEVLDMVIERMRKG